MMRILWFTNIPMPAVDRRTGSTTAGSGHWMSQLLLALRSVPGIELGVATAYPSLPDLQFDEDGVEYFVVGQGRIASHFGCTRSDLVACRDVVERFDPDLVHVHGSERFFGLLRARVGGHRLHEGAGADEVLPLAPRDDPVPVRVRGRGRV
jgi:hypothetical protein